MAGMAGKIRAKVVTALELTGIGLLDPLPAEEVAQGAIWIAIAAESICDPIRCQFDPNYDTLAIPSIPHIVPRISRKHVRNLFDPSAPTEVVSALSSALRSQILVASAEMCVLRTVFRRHSANEVGDRPAKRAQEAHRLELIEKLKSLQECANLDWACLKSLLKENKVPVKSITRRMFVAYQEHLDKHGFPHREELLFKAVGLTDIDIHWMRLVGLLAQPPKGPVSFTKMIDEIMLINTYRDIYECDCRRLGQR